MFFLLSGLSLAVGFFLELLVGWPQRLYHPIMAIGWLISRLESLLRRLFSETPKGQRAGGIVLAVTVPLVCYGLSAGLLALCWHIHPAVFFILQSLCYYSIFATGSLRDAGLSVYHALEEGVEAGRKAVSMIVGRDTQNLTEEGVIKAAVETIAENLSDGIIAPMLFAFVGGAPFAYFYKGVNTMDSMVGYKNEKYRYFGTGAAKLDDFCNFIPARLSALLMVLMAPAAGLDRENAWRIFRRDRRKHASPNSAQTESVMAGALHVQLAGDAYYFGEYYHKEFIGDHDRAITREDIRLSCRYLVTVCAVSAPAAAAVQMLFAFL